MKKSSMAVLTASVCVALSVSAFTLPGFANASLQKEQGKVMEKETPKEYMDDFNAQDSGVDESVIFLAEGQVQQLVTEAEQAYKKELDIEIPEGLEFECTANKYSPEDKTVYINLNWSGSTAEKQSMQFSARFESTNFPDEPASLLSIAAGNGFDSGRFENFRKEGMDTLKEELDLTVPDNYIAEIWLKASFEAGQQDKKITFIWRDPELLDEGHTGLAPSPSNIFYYAGFDKVDLSENTGRITQIEKIYEFTQQSIMEERAMPGYVEFTDVQQNSMLEAAKQFLAGKEIEIGNLRRSLQITIEGQPVMWFTFEAMGMNDSSTGSVFVTISPEFQVLGYSF